MLLMLPLDQFDFGLRQKSKNPDPFCSVGIGCIQPELVELVGTGFYGIKPDISFFSFPKFSTISLCYERTGKRKCFSSCFSPDQFCAGSNISPLVTSSHLQFAIHVLIQPIKIITLHKLVSKFSIADTCFSLDPFFNTVLCH